METRQDSIDAITERIQAELDRRAPELRLPHKNDTFVALRPVEAEVGIYFKVPSIEFALPIHVVNWRIPPGETLCLDYEPDHSESTHCSLKPMRYHELEAILVGADCRMNESYSHYSVSVSYEDLASEFSWPVKGVGP